MIRIINLINKISFTEKLFKKKFSTKSNKFFNYYNKIFKKKEDRKIDIFFKFKSLQFEVFFKIHEKFSKKFYLKIKNPEIIFNLEVYYLLLI